MMAPSGRARNPTARVAKEKTIPRDEGTSEKNTLLNTNADATP
jgi:hypothetical protein